MEFGALQNREPLNDLHRRRFALVDKPEHHADAFMPTQPCDEPADQAPIEDLTRLPMWSLIAWVAFVAAMALVNGWPV